MKSDLAIIKIRLDAAGGRPRRPGCRGAPIESVDDNQRQRQDETQHAEHQTAQRLDAVENAVEIWITVKQIRRTHVSQPQPRRSEEHEGGHAEYYGEPREARARPRQPEPLVRARRDRPPDRSNPQSIDRLS